MSNPFFQSLKTAFIDPFKKSATQPMQTQSFASPFAIPKPTAPAPMSVAPTPNMSYNTPPKAPVQNMSYAPAPLKPTGLVNSSGQPMAIPNINNTPVNLGTMAPKPTPVAPRPVAPAPVKTVTTDGKNMNPMTGGISDNPVPPPTYDTTPPPPPVAPATPVASPYETAVSDAEKNYKDAGTMTQEEIDAQANLDNLLSSTRLGSADMEGQGRGIPLNVILGKQGKLEKQSLLLAEPLQTKLARLQAKRTSALETSKFALDRADAKLKAEQDKSKPVTLGVGESIGQYDPKTGTYKTAYTAPKASTTTDTPASIKEYEYAKTQGYKGTFDDFKNNNKATDATQSPYQAERAARTIQSVDELLPQVNKWTTGAGSFLAAVPGSDAKYFRSQVDTLVANITYGELTAMREASKTGGALGQVSDKEGQLLGAALGALNDRAITPEQYKIQLQKVKDSIQRWQNAVNQSGSSNTGGSVVQTSIGPINTNW